jgi:signal transduction histidine kinase
MSPILVIDSYLDALTAAPFDSALLAQRIGRDADLLAAWLTTLGMPADPQSFVLRLEALAPEQRRDLGAGHALSVLAAGEDGRLAYTRWRDALAAACLAEALAHQASPVALLGEGTSLRWCALLARAGVVLPGDDRLGEWAAFRSAAINLLEDAEVNLRIFAVVDRYDPRDLSIAQEAAGLLLGMAPAEFQAALRRAEQALTLACQDLPIDGSPDEPAPDRVLQRLRVLSAGSMVRGMVASGERLEVAHELASRLLFRAAPSLLIFDAESARLTAPDASGPVISVASSSSAIARAFRDLTRAQFVDSAASSVADRQWLRRLRSETAFAIPVGDRGADGYPGADGYSVGVLLYGVDDEADADSETLIGQYAHELAFSCRTLDARARALTDPLTLFRERTEAKLRELVHEANNPLSIVQNYLHILELTVSDRAQAVDQVRAMGAELRRVSDLIARMRRATEEGVPAEDAEAIRKRHELFDLSALLLIVPPGPLMVQSDADQVAQIVTNVLKNALESGRGHQVRVEGIGAAFRDGREGVYVVVSDTGPGIPREVIARLGQPQPSTKGGDHMGVGLQVVQRLVAALGGSIDVRPGTEQGTSFGIFLPLTAELA